MIGVVVRLRLPSTCLLIVLLGSGCRLPNTTPERACARLFDSIREGDADAVFDALLQTTQWSLYTVAKEQQQMRELIERAYPPAERAAALQRLPEGAGGDGRALFRLIYPQRYAADFGRRLGSGPLIVTPVTPGAEGASCRRSTGHPFHLARSPQGLWGLSELDGEWEMAKIRAIHDLETVTENAHLYSQHGR